MLRSVRDLPLWVSFWLIYALGFILFSMITKYSLSFALGVSAEARIYVPIWVWSALASALSTCYLLVASVLIVITSDNTKYPVCSKVSRVTVIVLFVWWLARSYESYLLLKAANVY